MRANEQAPDQETLTMATQDKSNPVTDTVETATERLAELNEKAVSNSRKASTAYLTSYENVVVSLADSYEKAAGASRVEWLSSVAAAQADFTRELTKAYTAAARDLVS
jgi:hypothetical protein